MKIIERMKNIFVASNKLPDDFVRDAEFDVVLLHETFGQIPAVITASNGQTYVYFENVLSKDQINIVRKMGFRPRKHKSHKYTPAKKIYRAPISLYMREDSFDVIKQLMLSRHSDKYTGDNISKYQSNAKYLEYVQIYKTKTQ